MTGGFFPEILDDGVRNPDRFSFDACTGDSYIGEVGQDAWEEIDVEPAGSGNRNYGWRRKEGDACYNPSSNCRQRRAHGSRLRLFAQRRPGRGHRRIRLSRVGHSGAAGHVLLRRLRDGSGLDRPLGRCRCARRRRRAHRRSRRLQRLLVRPGRRTANSTSSTTTARSTASTRSEVDWPTPARDGRAGVSCFASR